MKTENTIEFDSRMFYDCEMVYGVTDEQKRYLNALIDLAPRKPYSVFIDLSRPNNSYVFLRYSGFDYPIKLEWLGKFELDKFLNNNVHAIASYLIKTGGLND